MELFPLQLFPGGGFDKSIVPVIYIGLVVLWFFAETYGFVFIGLVVPGYLAAVEVIAPASAAVVFLESLVTYAIVWGLSDGIGKRGVWSPFFGRDRFFAFLVVSVVVRLVGGLWLWPAAWQSLSSALGISASPPGPLSSLGLVLVPLTANMFWKIGVFRGTWQILLPSTITWAFTTYILLPYTNLRFSEFRLNFEDVAVDFLSSSRTYIVLLVAAALSARLNKRYGWDFGGILVPALLAVTWYTPDKALITFAEVLLLAGAASLIVSAPVVKNWNLEGPRRLILVFTVAFLFKWAASWVVVALAPSVQMTDFFGFGYLLSSLLALKILQKDFASTVLPAFAVSIAGFLAGSTVALGIQMTRLTAISPARIEQETTTSTDAQQALPTLVRRTALLRPRGGDRRPITNTQLRRLEAIGKRIRLSLSGEDAPPAADRPAEALAGLRGAVGDLGLEWLRLRERDGQTAYLMTEPPDAYPATTGWGLYLFRPGADGPLIEVPSPPTDALHLLGLYAVAHQMDARALMVGTTTVSPAGQLVEPRYSAQSPFHRLHRTLADLPVIQLRVGNQSTDSRIFVRRRLAARLSTDTLESLFGPIPVSWNAPPGVDRQREATRGSFTTIRLDADDLLQAAQGMAERRLDGETPGLETRPPTLQRHLEARILGEERRLAASTAALGPAPTPAEQTAIARSLVARLTHLSRHPEPVWRTGRIVDSLRLLARSFDLRMRRVVARQNRSCFWELSETDHPLRGIGLIYLACQADAPLLLEVPQPYDERSTWRVGGLLADGLDARALVIGSWSRPDPDQPPRTALEAPSMLVATHRQLNREYLDLQPPWTLQIRGMSEKRRLDGDLLVSLDDPVWPATAPAGIRAVVDRFAGWGLDAVWDDGRSRHADLRGFADDTLRYSRQMADSQFARLWFAAPLRHRLTPDPGARHLHKSLKNNDFQATTTPITTELARTDTDAEATVDQLREIARAEADRLTRFARTFNPIHLQGALDTFRDIEASPRLRVDQTRGQVWLVASTRSTDERPPLHLALPIRADQPPSGRVVHGPRFEELELVNASQVWSRRPREADQ